MSPVIADFDCASPAAFAEMLKVCGACIPAQQWANGRGLSLEAAFAECQNAEWFAWLAGLWVPDIGLAGKDIVAMRKEVGSATAVAKRIVIVGDFALTGYGSGSGSGDGYGSGYGYGDGDGYGYGYGDGYGYG